MGHKDIAQLLIESGAEVNAVATNIDPNRKTATFLCTRKRKRKKEKLRYFGNFGARPPPLTLKDGTSPLHVALTTSNNQEVAKVLIEHGADPNALDKDGQNPLLYALMNGQKEIAEFLIEQGPDPNVSDRDGQTPLHYAATFGYKEMVQLLIKSGADLNAADRGGRTPLDFAATPHVAQHLSGGGGRHSAWGRVFSASRVRNLLRLAHSSFSSSTQQEITAMELDP